jgi:hypothetical protein
LLLLLLLFLGAVALAFRHQTAGDQLYCILRQWCIYTKQKPEPRTMSHAMSIDSTDGSFFASYDEMTQEAVMAQAKALGISTKGKTKQQVVQEILKSKRKKASKKPEKKPESKSSSKKKTSHSKKPQRGDPRFVQGLANSGLLG